MKRVFVALAFFTLLRQEGLNAKEPRWVVYYDDNASIKEFAPYNPIVLDSDHHPHLEGLIQEGKTLLGYISLGEVENIRHYFSEVEAEGILLGENKNWPGSYFVDLRDPRWLKRVVEDLVPAILMKRFDGLFFDTLDNAAHLERSNPKQYKGMIRAAIQLVKAVRLHYPDTKIMLNRGYKLLPEVGSLIDMELGESVYTDYDFETKAYQRVPEALYQQQVAILQEAKNANPGLQVYTLDYWQPTDTPELVRIYEEERKNGFIPYVSTIELNEITPEPREKS